MQQTELKNLVFERFEHRRLELVKKRNRFQKELDQELHQLREAYGDTAVLSLGELILTLSQPQKPAPLPTEPPAAKKKPQSRRKRRRSDGEPSVTSHLAEHVPAAIKAVSAKMPEFRSKDILDHLVAVAKLKVTPDNVTLYLSQHASDLGLGVEKRVAGDRFPRLTNFFHLQPKMAAVRKTSRVNWTAAISTALKGELEGLKLIQLMARLRKAGIPAAKVKGPVFHGTLSRLVDRGTVTLDNNLYRLA